MWYDLSLVDGYTLPIQIKLLGNPIQLPHYSSKFNCGQPSCQPNQNFDQCPPELKKYDQKGVPIACLSLGKAINDNSMRSNAQYGPVLTSYYENNIIQSHILCSCGLGSCSGLTVQQVLSNIVNGPTNSVLHDTTGFCCSPNNPLYKNPGIEQHICYAQDKPMPLNNFGNGLRYDEIFKKTCPDAYSWEFDDENSTFQCMGDNVSYAIEFC